MPAPNKVGTKINIESYRQETRILKAKCPECEDGYLFRDPNSTRFTLTDHKFGGKTHECESESCKHRASLSEIYPQETTVLIRVEETDTVKD